MHDILSVLMRKQRFVNHNKYTTRGKNGREIMLPFQGAQTSERKSRSQACPFFTPHKNTSN